jgi:hypothetical protein
MNFLTSVVALAEIVRAISGVFVVLMRDSGFGGRQAAIS